MEITYEHQKLKRGQTAIIVHPAEKWDRHPIATTQIGVNRFGEFYKRLRFSSYNTYEEAIKQIKKFSKFPPDFLIIKRQTEMF